MVRHNQYNRLTGGFIDNYPKMCYNGTLVVLFLTNNGGNIAPQGESHARCAIQFVHIGCPLSLDPAVFFLSGNRKKEGNSHTNHSKHIVFAVWTTRTPPI